MYHGSGLADHESWWVLCQTFYQSRYTLGPRDYDSFATGILSQTDREMYWQRQYWQVQKS